MKSSALCPSIAVKPVPKVTKVSADRQPVPDHAKRKKSKKKEVSAPSYHVRHIIRGDQIDVLV